MSGFSSVAQPGTVPTHVIGGGPEPLSLFKSEEERLRYHRRMSGGNGLSDMPGAALRAKKVKVEIFDLSDAKQVRRYEKLWADLLEKASRMEVVVDSRKDLVHRPDGTSYWMKYVEYVEFEEADGGTNNGNK